MLLKYKEGTPFLYMIAFCNQVRKMLNTDSPAAQGIFLREANKNGKEVKVGKINFSNLGVLSFQDKTSGKDGHKNEKAE